jgi:hypothetical protein
LSASSALFFILKIRVLPVQGYEVQGIFVNSHAAKRRDGRAVAQQQGGTMSGFWKYFAEWKQRQQHDELSRWAAREWKRVKRKRREMDLMYETTQRSPWTLSTLTLTSR